MTACAAVLPVLGSALVWLPAAGYLALDGRYGAAAFMLASGAVVVSNLDNLVWLWVYRRVSGIHPMLTLVGALAGMRVFGMLGVLFGPLILSYFFELLRVYEETAFEPGADGRVKGRRPLATHHQKDGSDVPSRSRHRPRAMGAVPDLPASPARAVVARRPG